MKLQMVRTDGSIVEVAELPDPPDFEIVVHSVAPFERATVKGSEYGAIIITTQKED